MKYGESAFDLLYLLTAIVIGVLILRKARTKTQRQMGLATLILGCGDAFHLIPRVLNYFVSGDFSAALGIGKLVTSLTMTVFYLFLYEIYLGHYQARDRRQLRILLYVLAGLRILLCLFPQNGWLQNRENLAWGILRNIPFLVMGILIAALYYSRHRQTVRFRRIWLYVALSFLFYLPVVVGAGAVPALGALMLPKTVCYLLMIFAFYRTVRGSENT